MKMEWNPLLRKIEILHSGGRGGRTYIYKLKYYRIENALILKYKDFFLALNKRLVGTSECVCASVFVHMRALRYGSSKIKRFHFKDIYEHNILIFLTEILNKKLIL